ncbi:hypothetical protein ThimaDRAFT_1348 [Thiocapsa marina 5811]|uniref:Uncharacterized protein n=1 Tax=Thiocapsa marina 5811 TaxID=768671 RepID=F9U8U6_9GAMM|nr:hypothetical protein ThimaDRAFT_1348 [Thiocapsa marina 5811]
MHRTSSSLENEPLALDVLYVNIAIVRVGHKS